MQWQILNSLFLLPFHVKILKNCIENKRLYSIVALNLGLNFCSFCILDEKMQFFVHFRCKLDNVLKNFWQSNSYE